MYAVSDAAQSTPVTAEERGEEIKRRLDAIGISDREFYARTGIDRKTLNRAIESAPGVRQSTYMAIEAALSKLESYAAGKPAAVKRPADLGDEDYVEFTVEGNFGVRAVVKGPVKDMDQLQQAVSRLLREMRGDEGHDRES